MKSKKFYVYMVECSDNSYYTGYSTNVEKRMKQHKEGKGSKYLRCKQPIKFVYVKELSNLGKALKEEHKIKQLTHKEKRELFNSLEYITI